MDFSDRAMLQAACMTLYPSVLFRTYVNVRRNESSSVWLFYGMYDYPVIDYYFVSYKMGILRLCEFILRGGIFPFVEEKRDKVANTANLVMRMASLVYHLIVECALYQD